MITVTETSSSTHSENFAVDAYVSYGDQTTHGILEQTTEKPWKSRMREIQGAILTASIMEVVIGFTGIAGVLVRVIRPMTVAVIISLIGLSLVNVATTYSASNWWIALL